MGGGGVEVDDVTTRVGKEEEGGQVTGGLHTRLLLPVLLPCTVHTRQCCGSMKFWIRIRIR